MAEAPAEDLAITEEYVRELEEYLVRDELYRTVIARTPKGDQRLQMSGGDLLARLHRLQGERALLTAGEQTRLDTAQRRADQTIQSLRTRFVQRLQRELKARLDSLRWFLDECPEDMARCRTNYPFEIRNRQRIEEILKQTGKDTPAELKSALEGIDRRLRQNTHGAEFVWDTRLKDVYPSQPYWYLYARP